MTTASHAVGPEFDSRLKYFYALKQNGNFFVLFEKKLSASYYNVANSISCNKVLALLEE